MINAKGEWIYTNAEIAYELGLSPATVNAVGRRLFGAGSIAHYTANDVKHIVLYIKNLSVEEEEKRLNVLRDIIKECGYEPQEETGLKDRIKKDLHGVK